MVVVNGRGSTFETPALVFFSSYISFVDVHIEGMLQRVELSVSELFLHSPDFNLLQD